MKRIYQCPHCKAVLNPGDPIVLRADNQGQQGLMLFNPTPGNYEVVVPGGFLLRKHDVVRFSCPVCSQDLTSARNSSMAEIGFTTETGLFGKVAFSREFARHATYFISEERVETFGEHAEAGAVNFWGAGPAD